MTPTRSAISCACVAFVLGFLTSISHAGEIDLTAIHREVSPIARRLNGSGLSCRSLQMPGGDRHKLRMASLKLRLTDRVTVRAGVGSATRTLDPHLLAARDEGLGYAGTISVAVWQNEHFAIDLSLSGVRAEYDHDAVADGTVLVALRAL